MRVGIIDRDTALLHVLVPRLEREGHQVFRRADVSSLSVDELLDHIQDRGVHLLILDPGLLPPIQVIDLCHRLRRESTAYLLVVGRLSDAAARTRLLDAGADDCLSKPCDLNELLAHIRALLRRHPLAPPGETQQVVHVAEDWWVDVAAQRLAGPRGTVALPSRLFRLLMYLMRHEGLLLSRQQLLDAVWGSDYAGYESEVGRYVHYLRKAIERDAHHPRHILTRRSEGYEYRRPEEQR